MPTIRIDFDGDKVKKKEILFTIYSESKSKLDYAKDIAKLGDVFVIK